jgi:nicotinate-nucleotide pyrophosphorylase (carboxylating)
LNLALKAIRKDIESYFQEDDLSRNISYIASLPQDPVETKLYIKSDLTLCGLPWFVECFRYLGASDFFPEYEKIEGKKFKKGSVLELGNLPFHIALTGERIGLNLLQQGSSISTFTSQFVEKASQYGIAILDTRKTIPAHRALQKYAVRKGGGHNHRLGQTDVWMIKDNHKEFFGGISNAVEFFRQQQSFYTPLVIEIHNIKELEEAIDNKLTHLMLDNFSGEDLEKAIRLKKPGITYEVSGGVNLENLDSFLREGIDAISVGSLTYDSPAIDLSFKYSKVSE